ncbi:MAG: GrpB family protein [Butyricicoccaceae bacterium]
MLGLKRGTVALLPYQDIWQQEALAAIDSLKAILGGAAIDIQHVGSTAIPTIRAKPILDIVVGVSRPEDILPYTGSLEQAGFFFRGQDVPGQLLFVRGDLRQDTRTHHIHIVSWNGPAWKDYIGFRDYLIADPQKAAAYEACKQALALRFPNDRAAYTAGKQEIIGRLLAEAGLRPSGR